MEMLHQVIAELQTNGTLSQQYRPHLLHGKYEGVWECHIKGDWLLLWEQRDEELLLVMLHTGTHSDLFDHS